MGEVKENNKRIAKNTMFLYIRMIFILLVTLYTTRLILEALGIEDYGVYNVVGGFVSMFGFLNGALSNSTQRYITYALGKNDKKMLENVFSNSLVVHIVLGLAIVIITEIVGIWYMKYKMVIPADRYDAAFLTFHCSVFALFMMIISVPYNASIIAHEKMSAFAYISIFEVIMKLTVTITLLFVTYDKLKVYAFSILLIQIVLRVIYIIYCHHHFSETKAPKKIDVSFIKEMTSFAGWTLIGNLAVAMASQGVNMILNLFFGPVVNAARGITFHVQGAINQFTNSFQTSVNPQITKYYSVRKLEEMNNLVFQSSKFSFYLLLFLVLPILYFAPYILGLWLKNVPEYVVGFTRLICIISLVSVIGSPLSMAVSSTGNIKLFQSVVGGLLMFNLPIAYICLKCGGNAYSVFYIQLILEIISLLVRLLISSKLLNFSIIHFLSKVFLRLGLVSISLCVCMLLLNHIIRSDSFINVVLGTLFMWCSIILLVFALGVEHNERNKIILLLKNKLKANEH